MVHSVGCPLSAELEGGQQDHNAQIQAGEKSTSAAESPRPRLVTEVHGPSLSYAP